MLLCFTATLLLLLLPSCNAKQPNVVIIFGDDQGYGDWGAFGHPTSRTPHLDALAASGSKLVQYCSAANICSPSRGSLMTGKKFARLGIFPGVFSPLSKSGLGLDETTLPEMLKRAGYRTGMVGKWQVRSVDAAAGGDDNLVVARRAAHRAATRGRECEGHERGRRTLCRRLRQAPRNEAVPPDEPRL